VEGPESCVGRSVGEKAMLSRMEEVGSQYVGLEAFEQDAFEYFSKGI